MKTRFLKCRESSWDSKNFICTSDMGQANWDKWTFLGKPPTVENRTAETLKLKHHLFNKYRLYCIYTYKRNTICNYPFTLQGSTRYLNTGLLRLSSSPHICVLTCHFTLFQSKSTSLTFRISSLSFAIFWLVVGFGWLAIRLCFQWTAFRTVFLLDELSWLGYRCSTRETEPPFQSLRVQKRSPPDIFKMIKDFLNLFKRKGVEEKME